MHESSYQHMEDLADRYLDPSRETSIIDIGSFDVNGSYKPIFDRPGWSYRGVDRERGPNVDIVLSSPYDYPLPTGSVDLVVSGQAFEHVEFFWLTWLEIVRVLRPGGMIFLIAPSRGPEHRYPVDCWRYYPDGYRALAKFAGLDLLEAKTDWKPHPAPCSGEWGDTVGVFCKPPLHQDLAARTDEQMSELLRDEHNERQQLIRWVEGLSTNIDALLASKRWKLGDSIGELRRMALRRPHQPSPAGELRRVLTEFNEWRDQARALPSSAAELTPHFRMISHAARLSTESAVSREYLEWYYNTGVWDNLTFMGVKCLKSASDMWSYQEIISHLKPSLVVEFGTRFGGSALYFSRVLRAVSPNSKVVTVDVSEELVSPLVRDDEHIEMITRSSLDPAVQARLLELRSELPGVVFAILDSDHRKDHVFAEMELLRSVLVKGDYLVVEDGIVNGNPVLPDWGEGPLEAVRAYLEKYPDDYRCDIERETKFGFTFAPGGFLIRE